MQPIYHLQWANLYCVAMVVPNHGPSTESLKFTRWVKISSQEKRKNIALEWWIVASTESEKNFFWKNSRYKQQQRSSHSNGIQERAKCLKWKSNSQQTSDEDGRGFCWKQVLTEGLAVHIEITKKIYSFGWMGHLKRKNNFCAAILRLSFRFYCARVRLDIIQSKEPTCETLVYVSYTEKACCTT